jgi:pSer/pThr/pTyr-binding forkhead associated (FHA) protein
MNMSFTIPEAGVEPVPGYCLSERLGRGGYGEVWRAYAPGGFQVALKFVPLQDACGVVELRALDLIRDLRHPNLIVTFAAWQIEGWLIIAMELADRTLMDRYREARDQGQLGIPRDELLDYFQEAARGIDFLNEPRLLSAGGQRLAIQHRDIKPQNILLVGNGVKVADFGLARLMNQAETGHSGGMTPAYAAPEFFKGQTTSTSDQYCLAVTYCKIRGGCLPFEGTLPEVMAGHLSSTPDLRMIPTAEQAVVARALSKEPKDRWPSCRAFVEALLACDNVPQVRDPEPLSTIAYPGAPVTQSISQVAAAANAAPPAPPPVKPAASPPAPAAPAPSDKAFLTRMNVPPPSENSKTAPRAWIIGRDAGCHLIVNQNAVSGQHCRLSETAQGYFLEDLGSSNGTYVNGYKITGAVHVVPSDRVTLGQSVTMPWPSVSKTSADGQAIYIGRDAENDIVLDYTTVSNRHARIVMRSGQAHIEDLGSTNGIAIGQPNAKVSQAPLKPNDVVYFGSLAVPASRLLQRSGKQTGDARKLTFRGLPLVLGRDSSCDKILDVPMISGRHARLWREGSRIMIEDLGSTNGTFVNGERVHLSAEVKARDIIGMGSLLLELEVAS